MDLKFLFLVSLAVVLAEPHGEGDPTDGSDIGKNDDVWLVVGITFPLVLVFTVCFCFINRQRQQAYDAAKKEFGDHGSSFDVTGGADKGVKSFNVEGADKEP